MITNEEKKTLIAAACGQADLWVIMKRGMYYRPKACGYTYNIQEAWIVTEAVADEHAYPRGDEPVTKKRAPLPDYFNDLNACHEMEKTLVDWVAYRINLSEIIGIGSAPDLDICDDIKSFLSATASQRAEAFGKTLNLW